MNNIDYTKLSRIAGLCELLSDRAPGKDGLAFDLKINNQHATPYVSVSIDRWEGFSVKNYTMCTSPIGLFHGENTTSMGEMVELLEEVYYSAPAIAKEQAA